MNAEPNACLARRAAVHSALGDTVRLAAVDALVLGELSPSELQAMLDIPSNLLTHHLRILERAGIVARRRSEADRRRTYLGLLPDAFDDLAPATVRYAGRVVFVCTENSARSQLAAALWKGGSDVPATSAGTRPAAVVHPGAVAAARRHHMDLHATRPRRLADLVGPDDIVITVCDAAHEELRPLLDRIHSDWVHWSVTDPVRGGGDAAFDLAVTDLAARIARVAPALHPVRPGGSDGHHASAP